MPNRTVKNIRDVIEEMIAEMLEATSRTQKEPEFNRYFINPEVVSILTYHDNNHIGTLYSIDDGILEIQHLNSIADTTSTDRVPTGAKDITKIAEMAKIRAQTRYEKMLSDSKPYN